MTRDWHFPPLALPPLEAEAQRFVLLDGAQCDQPSQVLRTLPWTPLRLFDGLLADGSEDASVFWHGCRVTWTSIASCSGRLRRHARRACSA
ncbi:hypothetical protein NMB32_19600 [Stenotrophomonas sp. CD2]|nr:hypothetical protein NMB32_19600 [Stenotrophomonas sp. CD2]